MSKNGPERVSQEELGKARKRSHEKPGGARKSQKEPQNSPGKTRKSQGGPGPRESWPWAVGGDTSYIALSLKTPRFRRCKTSQQGGAKQSHAKPEKARKSQRVTEEPRIRQKQPGGAMRSQVRPGRARRFVREQGSGDF